MLHCPVQNGQLMLIALLAAVLLLIVRAGVMGEVKHDSRARAGVTIPAAGTPAWLSLRQK